MCGNLALVMLIFMIYSVINENEHEIIYELAVFTLSTALFSHRRRRFSLAVYNSFYILANPQKKDGK